MPTITIEGPPLDDLDRKRALVREMSEAAAKAFGLPVQAMIVLLKPNPPENVGVGGELLIDREARE